MCADASAGYHISAAAILQVVQHTFVHVVVPARRRAKTIAQPLASSWAPENHAAARVPSGNSCTIGAAAKASPDY